MLTEYTGAARPRWTCCCPLPWDPAAPRRRPPRRPPLRGPQRRCDRSGGSPGCSCSCSCSQPRGSCHNRSRDLLLDPALENPIPTPPLPLPSSLFLSLPQNPISLPQHQNCGVGRKILHCKYSHPPRTGSSKVVSGPFVPLSPPLQPPLLSQLLPPEEENRQPLVLRHRHSFGPQQISQVGDPIHSSFIPKPTLCHSVPPPSSSLRLPLLGVGCLHHFVVVDQSTRLKRFCKIPLLLVFITSPTSLPGVLGASVLNRILTQLGAQNSYNDNQNVLGDNHH